MDQELQKKIERKSTPEPNSGCWLWNEALGLRPDLEGDDGYGFVRSSGKRILAHRASYIAFIGEIPEGKIVRHRCDTPACVNPDHLELGSHRENAIDAHRRMRTKLSRASKEQKRTWAKQPSLSGLKASYGLSLIERIDRLSIPEPNTGCQLWIGPLNQGGYGKIKISGQMCGAHRISYSENCGPIPAGSFVLHKCDTPACVNPAHLFLGDAGDNMRDATKKRRTSWTRASSEQRSEWAKKSAVSQADSKIETAKKGWVTRHENGLECTLTSEQCVERTRRTWISRRQKYGNLGRSDAGQYSRGDKHGDVLKKGWANMLPEARAERVRKTQEGMRRAREAKKPRLIRVNLLSPALQ